jgi:hypothetical protein
MWCSSHQEQRDGILYTRNFLSTRETDVYAERFFDFPEIRQATWQAPILQGTPNGLAVVQTSERFVLFTNPAINGHMASRTYKMLLRFKFGTVFSILA